MSICSVCVKIQRTRRTNGHSKENTTEQSGCENLTHASASVKINSVGAGRRRRCNKILYTSRKRHDTIQNIGGRNDQNHYKITIYYEEQSNRQEEERKEGEHSSTLQRVHTRHGSTCNDNSTIDGGIKTGGIYPLFLCDVLLANLVVPVVVQNHHTPYYLSILLAVPVFLRQFYILFPHPCSHPLTLTILEVRAYDNDI